MFDNMDFLVIIARIAFVYCDYLTSVFETFSLKMTYLSIIDHWLLVSDIRNSLSMGSCVLWPGATIRSSCGLQSQPGEAVHRKDELWEESLVRKSRAQQGSCVFQSFWKWRFWIPEFRIRGTVHGTTLKMYEIHSFEMLLSIEQVGAVFFVWELIQ